MTIFSSSEKASAMPTHPAWLRAAVLMQAVLNSTYLSWWLLGETNGDQTQSQEGISSCRAPAMVSCSPNSSGWTWITLQHRVFILEKTWVQPFGTCHKKANNWGPLKVSLKGRLWKRPHSAKIHSSCQVYKMLLQHTTRAWLDTYSNIFVTPS